MASAWSLKSYVRKILFGAPSARSIPRPYENLGKNYILRKSSSYSATNFLVCSTSIFSEGDELYKKRAQEMTVNSVTEASGTMGVK